MISQNGNDVFLKVCLAQGVNPIDLIAKAAVWVAPETFRYLPVWYPEASRRAPMYDVKWANRYKNKNRETGSVTDKTESNEKAAEALMKSVGGIKGGEWTCCHIWGIDDEKFEKTNKIVQDSRFYSCVANMLYLPTPLKAFSDSVPEVKEMLRTCSYYLYDWVCDHSDVQMLAEKIKSGYLPPGYPDQWPSPKNRKMIPPNTVAFNDVIRSSADKRLGQIKKSLKDHANNPNYPKQQVEDTLKYWKINL